MHTYSPLLFTYVSSYRHLLHLGDIVPLVTIFAFFLFSFPSVDRRRSETLLMFWRNMPIFFS